MIEVIGQVLFELVGELLFNALIEGTSRSVAALLSNRTTRFVTGLLFSALAGFAGGYWWGWRLSGDRTTSPRTLYVSMVLAVFFALAAIIRARSQPSVPAAAFRHEVALGQEAAPPNARRPWHDDYWSPARLGNFAVVNAGIAVGVAVSFTPYVPG